MKTPEEFAEKVRSNFADRSGLELFDDDDVWCEIAPWLTSQFAAAIAEARSDEREACARVAEAVREAWSEDKLRASAAAAYSIAAAIRARGAK